MPTPKELFGHLSGGRVLDVATGSGGFIHFLLEGLWTTHSGKGWIGRKLPLTG